MCISKTYNLNYKFMKFVIKTLEMINIIFEEKFSLTSQIHKKILFDDSL